MPWNASKTANITGKEVLRFPAGLDAIKSVVLDATDMASWPAPTDGSRFQVPAGTILKLSSTNTDKYVKHSGAVAGSIKGVLAAPIDMVANATNAFEPAAMFFHQCVFATEAIVDFTLFASALVADLKTCLFS